MIRSILFAALLGALPWIASCASSAPKGEPAMQPNEKESALQIHYLEIVTPDVDATCAALEKVHGVRFGAPVPELGNARTAALAGGGSMGVRAPLRPDEEPVVRPYRRVDDIEAAVEASGGVIALPPTEMPGRGRFAIYFQGGIEHGLWQL